MRKLNYAPAFIHSNISDHSSLPLGFWRVAKHSEYWYLGTAVEFALTYVANLNKSNCTQLKLISAVCLLSCKLRKWQRFSPDPPSFAHRRRLGNWVSLGRPWVLGRNPTTPFVRFKLRVDSWNWLMMTFLESVGWIFCAIRNWIRRVWTDGQGFLQRPFIYQVED